MGGPSPGGGPLLPGSPRARAALSALFVFHLAMVVNYVWLDEAQQRWLAPLSTPWIDGLQLAQRWNMFRHPATWDVFLEADRTTLRCPTATAPPWTCSPDAEPLPISMAPPEGPFLRLRYDRMVKVHNNLAYATGDDLRYARGYARWLCDHPAAPSALAATDWRVVTLYKRRVRHDREDELALRPLPTPEEQRTELVSVVCASPKAAG